MRSNTSGSVGFLADVRRLNVAITRARRGLIVIGNTHTLAHNPTWQQYLHYLTSSGLVVKDPFADKPVYVHVHSSNNSPAKTQPVRVTGGPGVALSSSAYLFDQLAASVQASEHKHVNPGGSGMEDDSTSTSASSSVSGSNGAASTVRENGDSKGASTSSAHTAALAQQQPSFLFPYMPAVPGYQWTPHTQALAAAHTQGYMLPGFYSAPVAMAPSAYAQMQQSAAAASLSLGVQLQSGYGQSFSSQAYPPYWRR